MSIDVNDVGDAVAEPRTRQKRSGSEWEIVGGLKEGEKFAERPLKFDGYLHKKRNPPLKGWHKVGMSL